MSVALSLVPIFMVIGLGLLGARRGFFPPAFQGPANRLVFFVAVPALIFRAVAKAPLDHSLALTPPLIALAAMTLVWAVTAVAARWVFDDTPQSRAPRATWVQASIHGNIGIMGIAVILYALGSEALAASGLIITMMIVGQNLLSVTTYGIWGERGGNWRRVVLDVALNPVIIASLSGLSLAAGFWSLPEVLDRTLAILGEMGLPLALLLVGAKLAGASLKGRWHLLAGTLFLKLLVVPALGWGLLSLMGVSGVMLVVAVILLASPTATLCMVLADQLGGDPRLASQAISLGHACSALSYFLWLWLLGAG